MVTKITAVESPTKDCQLTGMGQWLEEGCCDLMLGVWCRHTERFVAGGKAVGEWLGLWSGTTNVQADRLKNVDECVGSQKEKSSWRLRITIIFGL